MKKRFIVSLMLVLAVAVMAFAPVQAQDNALNVAWPYQVPPTGHFNSFASQGVLNGGAYIDLHLPPLAVLMWARGEYEGMVAEEFGWDDDGNYVVKMVEGYKWSDGSDMTADDLMATFNIFRLRGDSVWASLSGVEKVDDYTVKFLMDEPSSLVERLILISNLRPASVYGDIANRAAELEPGDEWDALLTELTEFRPEEAVSGGPYTIVEESVSEANLTMELNTGGFAADIQNFGSVTMWNGETEVVTPLVANEELHYITHGIPPTTEDAFSEQGIEIVRSGMNSGPAIYVNHTLYPLNLIEVRQAIAYAIDREQNGFVSLGESGVAAEYMVGMSDGVAEAWLSDETLDSVNYYEYDPAMAEELLLGIGFSRNDDGIWVDDNGDTLSFELTFPQEFADWSAAAENATAQLNDFGFDITARGVQFQQHPQDVYDGNFEMAVRDWGIGDPIPARHYLVPYNLYNGQGIAAGETGSGMSFDVNVEYSGGEINVFDLANASARGVDAAAQAEIITELAVSYNEVLPAIPLWERYTNNALNRDFISLPDSSDPTFANFGGGIDNWMSYFILTGVAAPADM